MYSHERYSQNRPERCNISDFPFDIESESLVIDGKTDSFKLFEVKWEISVPPVPIPLY